jgi:capsular polysaccharide biosynthesis protein
MLKSLSLAGFNKNKIIEWNGSRAQFSQLVVGSVRFHTPECGSDYFHSPQAMSALGSRIRNNVGVNKNEKHRLYVSRADATERRVRNEKELISTLQKYGFERIVPSNIPFEDQVRKFANAEIILGPHGGGLTNLIFAEEATIVELFGSYQNPCYFGLARGMQHDYASVMCESVGKDIIVDVANLASLLDELIKQHS